MNAAYVSNLTTTMIKNQFHYHAVTLFVLNVLSKCISTKWLNVHMTKFLITKLQKIYLWIIKCLLLYQWWQQLQLMLRHLTSLQQQVWLDFVKYILQKKSSFIAKMIDKCSAQDVSWNILKWSMMLFQFLQKLKRWKKWSRKWYWK